MGATFSWAILDKVVEPDNPSDVGFATFGDKPFQFPVLRRRVHLSVVLTH